MRQGILSSMTTHPLTPLERDVTEMLLRGDAEVLHTLRRQLSHLSAREREYTGVGFFTVFAHGDAPEEVPNHGRLIFGDVAAEIPGAPSSVGFVLYIEGGQLSALEAYTYDDPWPENIATYRLFYNDASRPGLPGFLAALATSS